MVWYRCSVRSFFLMFQWVSCNVGRVLSIITVQKSFYILLSNYNYSAHNVVNYRDASPFKDLFDSTVFGFVQSDLRSNIAVRLYFPPVCLNSSRYPHFLLGPINIVIIASFFGFIMRDIKFQNVYHSFLTLSSSSSSGHSLGRSCQIRLSNHSSPIWNIGSFSWIRKHGIQS